VGLEPTRGCPHWILNLVRTVEIQLEKQWKVIPDKGFTTFSVGKALYPNWNAVVQR